MWLSESIIVSNHQQSSPCGYAIIINGLTRRRCTRKKLSPDFLRRVRIAIRDRPQSLYSRSVLSGDGPTGIGILYHNTLIVTRISFKLLQSSEIPNVITVSMTRRRDGRRNTNARTIGARPWKLCKPKHGYFVSNFPVLWPHIHPPPLSRPTPHDRSHRIVQSFLAYIIIWRLQNQMFWKNKTIYFLVIVFNFDRRYYDLWICFKVKMTLKMFRNM